MKTRNSWEMILETLEPDIFSLKQMIEKGSPVKPFLRMIKGKWAITLEDCWDQDFIDDTSVSNLDERCEWASKHLASWSGVTRIGYQDWIFPNKEAAEKFITVYSLIWEN